MLFWSTVTVIKGFPNCWAIILLVSSLDCQLILLKINKNINFSTWTGEQSISTLFVVGVCG